MQSKIIKKALLLMAGLLTVSMVKTPVHAANVSVNENTFPDPTFRAYVLEEFDTNHDNALSQEEIEAVTYIYCAGDYDNPGNIQTLQGVEYFTELYTLSFGYNQVTNLDLSHNTKLIGLYCDANPLTGLDISYLQNLQWLDCSACGLKTLDVSAFTELAVLYCSNNQLTSLDLHNNTKLATLGCSMNKLVSIDLSNNTQLGSLQVQGNNINVLDIRNIPTLIDIYNNGDGPLENYVGCCYAMNQSYVWTDENVLVVTEVPSGNYLVDVWAEPALGGTVTGYGIYQSGKTVTLKAEAHFGYQFAGWVENGQVISTNETITFKAKKDRKGYAKFEVDPAYADGLLINEQNFPDATFRAYVKAQFDSDNNGRFSLEELANVTNIECNGDYYEPGSITTLKGIEYFEYLASLNCSYNQISSLDISHNKKLEFIDCSNNSLSSIDISANPKLTTLNCNNNQITSMNLSGASNLESLFCGVNLLQSIDLSDCVSLTNFSCYYNQLTSLDVSACTNLRYLECTANDLASLDISQCVYLNATVLSTEGVMEYGSVVYSLDNYQDELRVDSVVEVTTTDGTIAAWLSGYLSITGYLCYGGTMECEVIGTNNTGTLYYQWTINGSPISGATQQSYTCVASDVGKALGCIVTSSSHKGQLVYDSEWFIVDKAMSPAPPVGITAQCATSETSNDGKLIGTTTAMEYADNYEFVGAITCQDGETTGLSNGYYYIRMKETDTTYAGQWAYAFVGVKEDYEPVTMVNAKAALDGKIGLVYGVNLPEWLQNDYEAYAIITVNGVEYKQWLSDVFNAGQASDDTYRIAQYVPAAYYRETMNLRIFTSSNMRVPIIGVTNGRDYTETGVDYSLERYVKAVRNAGATGNTLALVNAIEDYCTASQIYFDHNSNGLSVSNAVTNLGTSALANYASTGSQNYITGITGKKLTVSFESDNSIKLGLKFASGVNLKDYKFYVDKASAKLKYQEGFGYYLVARNIPAALLDIPHEFKVKKGTETYVINCSALTYARAIVGNADEKVVNLAKSLYLYNQAAKNYFGIQ